MFCTSRARRCVNALLCACLGPAGCPEADGRDRLQSQACLRCQCRSCSFSFCDLRLVFVTCQPAALISQYMIIIPAAALSCFPTADYFKALQKGILRRAEMFWKLSGRVKASHVLMLLLFMSCCRRAAAAKRLIKICLAEIGW